MADVALSLGLRKTEVAFLRKAVAEGRWFEGYKWGPAIKPAQHGLVYRANEAADTAWFLISPEGRAVYEAATRK